MKKTIEEKRAIARKKTRKYYQKYGHTTHFKKKRHGYHLRHYAKHRERYLKRSRQWRQDNLELKRNQDRQYRLKNLKIIKEYQKKYRIKNKNRIRQIQKEYYLKNKKRLLEYNRKRLSKNPMLNKPFKLRFEILTRDNFTCQYCGRTPKEDKVKLAVDHIIPKSKGGTDKKSNLITSCKDCNAGKGDVILHESEDFSD